MGYIKSKSNYVIQKKHQSINDGFIYERDFNTLGGIGDMPSQDNKYYKNGTFIFGKNDSISRTSYYATQNWLSNGEKDYWTSDDVLLENEIVSLDIVLKQDIQKLKDFAYYGSCVELIRASINDIIDKFPGEIYTTDIEAKKMSGNTIVNIFNDDTTWYVVDNPFNLDLHTPQSGLTWEEKENITYIQSHYGSHYNLYSGGTQILGTVTMAIDNTPDSKQFQPYERMGDITFTKSDGGNTEDLLTIRWVRNENCEIIYVASAPEFAIRPKDQHYKNFISKLDTFQQILLNDHTNPKYSAIFEVMDETEDGFHMKYEKFTFPLGMGNYNLGITTPQFQTYIDNLVKYAELFDNMFCHNLYRSLTHESIKNFDWTDTLQRGEETKEEYFDGGDKIQKMINICGREFDEIKFYIDGIANTNNITYNDAYNIPDYFLTDTLNIEGWDVKNVFPFNSGKTIDDAVVYPFVNQCGDGKIPNDYYSGFFGDGCQVSRSGCTNTKGGLLIDNQGFLRHKIHPFRTDKAYSMQEMNNHFMKLLKLNSRAILRTKGTIESLEMILSLFGLRSKRMYESIDVSYVSANTRYNEIMSGSTSYDYEINEYIAVTNAIEDANKQIDELNKTKNIAYNTVEYANGVYVPYQGLPVRYYEVGGNTYLCPYFSNDINIDGKPYYQMYGGWAYNEDHFTDTNTIIPCVQTLTDLISIPRKNLYNGIIYKVNNISGNWVSMGGALYEIYTQGDREYVSLTINNNALVIGGYVWTDTITLQISSDVTQTYDLNNFPNGSELKMWIFNDKMYLAQNNHEFNDYTVLRNGTVNTNGTNYFQLFDINDCNSIGLWGWNQLTQDSSQYNTIKKIQRNRDGNNPHQNGLTYDNGVEYVKYFAHLFKYAVETESFNEKCFPSYNDYVNAIDSASTYGFTCLLDTDDDCKNDFIKHESSKTHSFIHTYEKHFNEISGDTTYNIWDSIKDEIKGNINKNYKKDIGFTDQIINVKNVLITFYIPFNNQEEKEDIKKYYDEIIIHYLLQVIPPSTILKIEYVFFKTESKKAHSI